MLLFRSLLFLPLVLAADRPSSDESPTTTIPVPACTASSSSGTGAFFDLRPEMAVPPVEPVTGSTITKGSHAKARPQQQPPQQQQQHGQHGPQPRQPQQPQVPAGPDLGGPTVDYKVRGWDYGMNFTMNLCGAVVDPIRDVAGVQEDLWRNVSAYYTTRAGDRISIGQQSMDLVSRGRKLVLTYTDGSPCDGTDPLDPGSRPIQRRGSGAGPAPADYGRDPSSYRFADYSDEEETGATDYEPMDRDSGTNPARVGKKPPEPQAAARAAAGAGAISALSSSSSSSNAPTLRKKSSIISFHCDRDPSLTHAAIAFVGTPDNCAYFFEVRSQHACARAEPDKPGSVGPGGVFGLILAIAIMVYLLGGVFYNRTVTHARGWRQLPNHGLWAGIWNSLIVSLPCPSFLLQSLLLLPESASSAAAAAGTGAGAGAALSLSRMSPPLPRYQPPLSPLPPHGDAAAWKGRTLR